jgi:hypothetical protein
MLLQGIIMLFGEQMCLKLCVIVIFCEFSLKCFQLQSCTFSRYLFNDRYQTYIKNEHEMIMFVKDFEFGPSLGESSLLLKEFVIFF